ncbi:MAG: leucine-rich repeat protein [Clostridia bacterium]|nr:leucine-rich repeat protein [Clostridia bacterium]
MRKNIDKKRHFDAIIKRCTTAILVCAMLVQTMGFGVGAIFGYSPATSSSSSSGTSANTGSLSFDSDEVSEQLRGDILKSLRADLVQRVDKYELSGPVGLIITFSDDSLLSVYSDEYADEMSYEEFKATSFASSHQQRLNDNRKAVIEKLEDAGLIFDVKHTYVHTLDGIFVQSTYEDIAKICDVEGVERVMVSNTYEPLAAVENPVDVYETGIFNSGSVEYTGKGTIVAVLDTGCDYAHSAFTSYNVVDPLYDRDDIEAVLDKTNAYELTPGLEAREVYYGNITGNKIAFGYDYADKDPDIMPFSESHGTHVAGIIAGKDDVITGVAIDAQLAIMKVFSDYDVGAEDGDIIAALEDCIVLNVDAINMSLGSSCGFSYESEQEELYKNELYQNIENAGISLIVAASNDYSSAYGGEGGNTNKTDNPDSATVGSPASYPSSFAVASVSGKKENYMLANGEDVVFFIQSYSTSAEEYDFFEMMGIKPGEKKTYEYVTVPGLGLQINYAGLDMKGKIALVSRGDITFEEKVQFAQEAGAIAVIIYNNVFGDITMTIGNHAKIPAVSIGKDEGEMLAAHETGTFEFDLSNVAGPFMSDFSSWGPTPDLKLKPEITAHGGNINSAVVGGEYDELSGTSMAAPNMCGITVLIRQYVNEKFKDENLSATEARDLVNRLCMSTATIALDKKGNPYSPRKQGAGLADIRKATTTAAYLLVDGIGKTKLELGDDPYRTGVYEMEIALVNISDRAQSYRLGNITMTESISTSDPEYVAEIAYLLSNATEYSVEGGVLKDGVVTVSANETATVKVKITLSDADKSYLDSTFENGMFVEGYLTFDNTDEAGVDLNAPFLAFYGSWGDAPVFDLDYYEVETEAHDDAIDDDDKIKADYYATTPLGIYYYDYIIPLGTYLYEMDEEAYSPIPATREHAAVSLFKNSISGIYGVLTGLLRGAKEMTVTMVNTDTGEVVFEMVEYNCSKAHASGGTPYGYMSKFDLDMYDDETGTLFANNNEHFEVTMSAKLDWDGGENVSDTYSFSFYVDYEAPTVTESSFRTEYDKAREENRYYLDVMIYDNHYAMSCRPVIVYDNEQQNDDDKKTFSSLAEYPIPIYQQNKGENTKVTIEITDYIDIIKRSATPNGITLYIDDYAMNANICYVPFPETDVEDIKFKDTEKTLDINQTFDLTTFFTYSDGTEIEDTDYLHTLRWSSSDESVVIVKDGNVEALKEGTATIKVTSDSWAEHSYVGLDSEERPVYESIPQYKEITINVTSNVMEDDPNSGKNVQIEDLVFSSYETLFAFTSDIDFSEIGSTGSTNYFDGNYSIKFYPSEKIKLNYELKPWNFAEDRYELIWSTSNPKVVTVDDQGVVTAQAEGKARVTLQIKINDKISLLAARLSVEVKSEFIIENRELVAYKGWGGDVVIPDDEGILYIGAFAFSHFDLDNEKYVEKDEDGYYDFDLKKSPIGNDTVTSVVIPEGVENIEKYAFYNCSKLEKVVLPESCEMISLSAFQKCPELVDINLENVKIIADYAFYQCGKLSCAGLEGGVAAEGLYAVGTYAFASTAIESLNLLGLSRTGKGAFANCKSLKVVTLGQRTRVSEAMFENTAIETVVIYSDTVGNRAFANCTSLTSVTLMGDVTFFGDEALTGCTSLNSFEVKGQLEQIGARVFNGCTSINEITLPDGTVSIDDEAFVNSGINKLVFKTNTVIGTLGNNVFPTADFSIDITQSNNYKVVDGAIYDASGETLVFVLSSDATTFTVPKTVKYIGTGAFTALKNLNVLNFEDASALVSIGKSAFTGCKNLTTVNLPLENKISILARAFYGLQGLVNIDLSNVTEIGDYAFYKTALESVALNQENVEIGKYAFAYTSGLKTLTLGDSAVIGEGAFKDSSVVTVTLDGDAKIGARAFQNCRLLTSFDFLDVSGEIGQRAFYGCEALTEVNAPKITSIAELSFANCKNLALFSADNLVTIKDGAFYDMNADASDITTAVTALVDINLPNVKTVGAYAFAYSATIKTVNLPSLESLGEFSFAICERLTTITMSEAVTEIPNQAFYLCIALTDFDFTNIERIGSLAFCGVSLPEELVLPNVVYLDKQALAELEFEGFAVHSIKSVEAPKLTYIGDEAFGLCTKLRKFNAPLVEHIGDYAFSGTFLDSFEVTDSLVSIGRNPFIGCERFEVFYVLENDEWIYDKVLSGTMIENGVLYSKNARGYTLSCYPEAKRDSDCIVPEGTTRISPYAVANNTNLETLVLPVSLRSIADFAFFGCENLNTVTFKSYYAPTLEGSMSTVNDEVDFITVDNQEEFPGLNDLYEYSFSFLIEGWTSRNLYHTNFKAGVGSKKAVKMTAVIPENCVGYDSLLYKAYFNVTDAENSGKAAGRYAIAFMEAVYNLPENIDRFDKLLMEEAIGAYNALEVHKDEKGDVDAATLDKFTRLRSIYNVNVVDGMIARLFGMYNTEHSFNKLKEATGAYLALSDEERAMVAHPDVLDTKLTQLTAAMGVEVDFSKSYSEHFASENPPSDEPPVDNNDGGGFPWPVVAIVAACVVVAAGAVSIVFIFLKRKKAILTVNGADSKSAEADTEPVTEDVSVDTTAEADNDSEAKED